ncbi:uncharacterized protein LOC142235507 [Haematobia irritans]|uniref:uncharacterized protein LOC142235507 n=1 Tax=Haematobia irritans TaxID=7368 RepID=UPI003F50837C
MREKDNMIHSPGRLVEFEAFLNDKQTPLASRFIVETHQDELRVIWRDLKLSCEQCLSDIEQEAAEEKEVDKEDEASEVATVKSKFQSAYSTYSRCSARLREPHDIVSKIPLTNENFDVAWSNLCARYENKRVLVNIQLKTLFSLSTITTETGSSLKTIQRDINACISLLNFYGVDVNSWGPIFVFVCYKCLPDTTLTLWEQTLENKAEIPKWSDLDEFLTNRHRTLESVSEMRKSDNTSSSHNSHAAGKKSNQTRKDIRTFQNNVTQGKCSLCHEGNHVIRKCSRFLRMDVSQRYQEIKKNGLCVNCFSRVHTVQKCNSKFSCLRCNKRHNTLLHRESVSLPSNSTTTNAKKTSFPTNTSNTPPLSSTQSSIQSTNMGNGVIQTCFASDSKGVLLGTAIVHISHCGVTYVARALVDSGSQGTFISERLFNTLKLLFNRITAQISGLNNTVSAAVQKECSLSLQSVRDPNTIDLSALPSVPDIPLADPLFFESSKIDILIGGDLLPSIMLSGIQREVCGSLLAQETVFGWILTGPAPHYYLPHHAVVRPESTTTRVRVVFNASSASSNGMSLNDVLYPSPILQQDLIVLVLRWRFFRFIFNGDITKMYRQILINPNQAQFQRILFRENPNEKVQDFELTTVTFGIAENVHQTNPLASEILRNSMYVDDILAGAHSVSSALESRNQLISALNSAGEVQLHGFSDASEKAYAAALYIRISHNGSVRSHLICSKTKVAPIKTLSIPRLELCGATLLADMIDHLVPQLQIGAYSLYCWTNSTIVLSWLAKPACFWNTFVANRVSRITEVVSPPNWYHVRSESNPADLVSRGVHPSDLVHENLWWHGPDWLKDHPSKWPRSENTFLNPVEIERKHVRVNFAYFVNFDDILERFSSLPRALRVVAYMYRFFYSTNPRFRANYHRASKDITTYEIVAVQNILISMSQKAFYPNEYMLLSAKKQVASTSSIVSLNPFIDPEGIMSICGRLVSSPALSYDERHPIILSYCCQYSRLLVKFIHDITLHGGNQLVLKLVRTKYWIPRVKNMIKATINKCKPCVIYRHRCQKQLMSALPPERSEISRPFSHTGLDFAGPFDIKTYAGRNFRITKAMFAFFRFVSRRGCPLYLHSDNGTTFVGASKVLAKEFIQSSRQAITSNYAHQNITWQFIPSGAPHMGGLWEAGVKSFKIHFRKVAQNFKHTFEEFQTLLSKIEACLNSRPLSPTSQDPTDLSALTPGHFLIGSPILVPIDPNIFETPMSIINRWQRLKAIHQHFCSRWKDEYLKELHKRHKWQTPTDNLKENTLVVVREENLPPQFMAVR